MPAVFRDRITAFLTPLTTFSTTMSFCAEIQPRDANLPDFFSIGGPLFQSVTNIGDYIINLDIDAAGRAQIATTIVHFSTEEQFYFWRHDLKIPTSFPRKVAITVDINGSPRAPTDVRVYENGTEVELTTNFLDTGTATAPNTTTQAWFIGGTNETGAFATNGFNGLIANAGIFTRILTASEIQQLAGDTRPENLGASLDAPLYLSPTELVSNGELIRRSSEATIGADEYSPNFENATFFSSDAITEFMLEAPAAPATPSISPLSPVRLGHQRVGPPRLGPIRIA